MRLFELYQRKTINESGSMAGTGAIHISEIGPTLAALEKKLGIDLRNNALGSVGKKQFSGDIDIALDVDTEQLPEFVKKLEAIPEILDITRSSVIMTKVKIVGYDPNLETDKNRTGYVQIDFMPGDPNWLKTYFHAPHETESEYPGSYRTILLATIAAVHNQKNSTETTDDGRPLKSERFMFSPRDGLVRIMRTPEPKKNGPGYTKKNINKIVGGPWTDADEIAQQLDLGTAKDLNSYETLKVAIEKNYPADEVEKILSGFADNEKVKSIGVPKDLQ